MLLDKLLDAKLFVSDPRVPLGVSEPPALLTRASRRGVEPNARASPASRGRHGVCSRRLRGARERAVL